MPTDGRAYRFCGETIVSDIDLPFLRRSDPVHPACTIERAPTAETAAGECHWFHHWRIGRRRPWLSFARLDAEYLLRFPELADFRVSVDGARIRACPSPALPDDTLRHLLLDQVLPLALTRRGRVLLHASAVHVPGIGALAFAGPTGRGKSTLAAAFAANGGRILTDDCLALERHAACFDVLPAYPGLRLWPDAASRQLRRRGMREGRVAHYTRKRRVRGGGLRFHPRPSPLRAIFVLSPRRSDGPLVSITRGRASARLMALVKHSYVLDIEDRDHLARAFSTLAAITTSIPVHRLRVRDGYSRLTAAVEKICAHVGALPPGL